MDKFSSKRLDRAKKREWCKNGKTNKYCKLKEEFERKYKEASQKYLEKNVRELKESDPGRAYSTLKKM